MYKNLLAIIGILILSPLIFYIWSYMVTKGILFAKGTHKSNNNENGKEEE